MKSVTIKVEVELIFALSLYPSPTGEGFSTFSLRLRSLRLRSGQAGQRPSTSLRTAPAGERGRGMRGNYLGLEEGE